MLENVLASLRNVNRIFLATVVAPTTLAIVYFGIVASDIYVSEAVFVVRQPDKPAGANFGLLLKSTAFSNASDEIYAAQAYVQSRDALRQLNQGGAFEQAFTRPSISWTDRFNPLGLKGSFEDLYQFYQRKVSINYDTSSSITTLAVRAYTREDAHRINEQLLQLTEATVNHLNQRASTDLVRFAEHEVAEAEQRDQAAAVALSQFRNRSGIIDPEKQAVIQMQMISKLQDQLIATNTQLAQLRDTTPENSQIPVLRTTAAALRGEIDRDTREVAGNTGSLSGVAVEYQRLLLENQFADHQLAATMASLAEARAEARKQHAYIDRIAQPSLPDTPLEPHRLRGVLTTFVLGLIAFGILSMLLAGIREHQD